MNTAYLAGLVDSDGAITFGAQWYGGPNPYINPQIAIVSRNKKHIEWICDEIGSRLERRKNTNGKEIYHAVVRGRKNVERYLSQILSHLHMKRRQAELMLEFIRRRKGTGKTHRTISHKEKSLLREFCALNMKSRLSARTREWLET